MAHRPRTLAISFAALAVVALHGQNARETLDYPLLARIQDEGLNRSQVMDHVGLLSDVYGPRLTGSPGFEQAAAWAMKRLADWGLGNARLERWKFGKGWSLTTQRRGRQAPMAALWATWSGSRSGRTSTSRSTAAR
jgi:hypothetical protein